MSIKIARFAAVAFQTLDRMMDRIIESVDSLLSRHDKRFQQPDTKKRK